MAASIDDQIAALEEAILANAASPYKSFTVHGRQFTYRDAKEQLATLRELKELKSSGDPLGAQTLSEYEPP